MTSLQFVERRGDDQLPVIDAIDGAEQGQESVRGARLKGFTPLLWGSWDLVEIVGRLIERGARAIDATLITEALDRVTGEEAEAAAEEIVEALNHEDLDAVAADLRVHAYLVAALTVNFPGIGLVRLIQNGQADILNDVDRSTIIEVVRPALRAHAL